MSLNKNIAKENFPLTEEVIDVTSNFCGSIKFMFRTKNIIINNTDYHTTVEYDGLSLVEISNENEGYSISPFLMLKAVKEYLKEDFTISK